MIKHASNWMLVCILLFLWALCGVFDDADANPILFMNDDGYIVGMIDLPTTWSPKKIETYYVKHDKFAVACEWVHTPDHAVICKPN